MNTTLVIVKDRIYELEDRSEEFPQNTVQRDKETNEKIVRNREGRLRDSNMHLIISTKEKEWLGQKQT